MAVDHAMSPTLESNPQVVGDNLRRLMARDGLKQLDVVQATGLDERTVRSLLRGRGRPHSATLHKLAIGLGVDPGEFLCNLRDEQATFDRATNPAVAEVVKQNPDLFAGWTRAEFNELASRFGIGGQLTLDGVRAAAQAMNRRRQLIQRVLLLYEGPDAECLEAFVEFLYERMTTF